MLGREHGPPPSLFGVQVGPGPGTVEHPSPENVQRKGGRAINFSIHEGTILALC
jgi:hypothetical protein